MSKEFIEVVGSETERLMEGFGEPVIKTDPNEGKVFLVSNPSPKDPMFPKSLEAAPIVRGRGIGYSIIEVSSLVSIKGQNYNGNSKTKYPRRKMRYKQLYPRTVIGTELVLTGTTRPGNRVGIGGKVRLLGNLNGVVVKHCEWCS